MIKIAFLYWGDSVVFVDGRVELVIAIRLSRKPLVKINNPTTEVIMKTVKVTSPEWKFIVYHNTDSKTDYLYKNHFDFSRLVIKKLNPYPVP
ncbi:hypothetical protein EB796_009234 [Bugula neritina]|uniref:Uncharacterized protein n=1 Tax=Bugula neritina TaxID=10212 RepID=A0A7J7K1B0_BUGNE|nr:hypothetical protein EB796_009234 [Bugula neritina]